MKKFWLRFGIAAVCVVILLTLATRLLMPKYVSNAQEGRLIAEYYDSDKNHDLLFIGDCEVYESFDPALLWEEYGIPSYIRGSPQQLIWQSYYLLEETYKYETPKAVVFNVLSMKYSKPQNDAYNRLTVDGMRPSVQKYKCAAAGLVKEGNDKLGINKEDLISYFFPLLRFHSRWSDLDSTDFKYWLKKTPRLSVNGYMMNIGVKGTDFFPKGQVLADYTFGEIDYEYLDKIRMLCEKKGSELVLIKAPSTDPYYYDEWDEQIDRYAEQYGLKYYNFLDSVEQIGIDYMTDTYDEGKHLNYSGVRKLTSYFGAILQSDCSLPDHRGENKYDAEWEKIVAFRDEMRQMQAEYLQTNESLRDFYYDIAK